MLQWFVRDPTYLALDICYLLANKLGYVDHGTETIRADKRYDWQRKMMVLNAM